MNDDLIGRERERGEIARLVADAEVCAIILRGPGGVGKSVLAAEALARCAREGGLTGACKYADEGGAGAAAPLLQALAQAVSSALEQLYDPAAGLENFSRSLGRSLAPLAQAGFHLEGLAAPPAPETPGRRETSARLRASVLKCLDWLDGFGLPVMLLVDDWRRAGADARALITVITGRSAQTQLTLLLTERPGAGADAGGAPPGAAVLDIGGLDAKAAARLVSARLTSPVGDDAVIAWLGREGPWLPFDLIEAAREFERLGGAGEGAALEAVPVWPAAPDPGRFAANLARRLEGACAATRRTALGVALVGDAAAPDLLALALGLDVPTLEGARKALEGLWILRPQGPALALTHDRLRTGLLTLASEADKRGLAAEMADRQRAASADPASRAAHLAASLRCAAGVDEADPDAWGEHFACAASAARARADMTAASRFAEAAFAMSLRSPPAGLEARRRLLREAALAAADRKDAGAVRTRGRAMIGLANSGPELAAAYETTVTALRLAHDLDEAWRVGREGLACFGVRVPDKGLGLSLLAASITWRAGRPSQLRGVEREAAPEVLAFARFTHAAAAAAYEKEPRLAALIALRALERLPRRSRRTPYWLSVDAFVAAMLGRFEEAADLGALVASLGDGLTVMKGVSLYQALYWGVIWRRPQAELRAGCAEIFDIALAEGDLIAAATALRNSLLLGWRTSPSLTALAEEVETLEADLDWLGDGTAQTQAAALKSVIAELRGQGPARTDRAAPTSLPAVLLAVETSSLWGDWFATARRLRDLHAYRRAFDSHPGGVIWRFHECLAKLKTGGVIDRRDLRFIERAARLNPTDHRHKALVVHAERLRARGRRTCLSAYAVAVDAAAAGPSPLEAGLAAELAADAARQFKDADLEDRFARRAEEVWTRWGADAKRTRAAVLSAPVEAKLAEAEADAASAKRSDRAKSRLLADVAHELRTPMQGMQGLLDLAREGGRPLDLEAFDKVFRSLRVMVDDLTDFGALGSGEMKVCEADGSLRDLLASEFDLIRARPELRLARLDLIMDPDAPDLVSMDADRVRQVVRNLLSNAAKYGGGAHVGLRLSLDRVTPASRMVVRVTVEDDGPGLSPADVLLIFEPFERGRRHGDGQGLGLGLPLSRRIAERLNGRLDAESPDGAGARFVFTFEVGPPGRAAAAPVPARRGPARILLAEDVALNRRVLAALLRARGHEVLEAADGTQALRLLETERVSLALLDISMPGASGLEILRAVRSASWAMPAPRVAVLTASPSPALSKEALSAGADLVLRKPLSAADLDGALSALLGSEGPIKTPLDLAIASIAREAQAELRARIRRLDALLGAQSANAGAAEAHRIAGLAAQFGWPAIAEAAEILEDALVRGEANPQDAARSLFALGGVLEDPPDAVGPGTPTHDHAAQGPPP